MGTTLDNGTYLPDEGERNCYDGLAGNWVALDNHLGSTNIHVTINDKQAWNGHVADTTIHVTSADKQTWNSHVADTTIHVTSADKQAWNGHVADSVKPVTAEDKNKWDAVTSKADDSAVVHNTGNETVAGIKSFSDDTFVKSLKNTREVTSPSASSTVVLPIVATVTYTDQSPSQSATVNLRISADGSKSFYPNENGLYSLGLVSRNWDNVFSYMFEAFGKNLGNEFSNNARTDLYLKSNRDASGQSGVYISKFRQNRAQGEMGNSDVVQVTFDVLENSVRTNRLWYLNWVNWENDVPKTVEVRSFCAKVDYKLTHINDTEPSALSMPDLNNGIDISSYITHLDKVVNNYTPPANGWLSIRVKKTSLVHASLMIYQTGGLLSSCETDEFNISGTNLPVIANQNVEIYIYADVLVSAKFYPCQGNV